MVFLCWTGYKTGDTCYLVGAEEMDSRCAVFLSRDPVAKRQGNQKE
jgi:hypothetical protein